jgi:probable F420-dependent oxidoreductase
VGPPLKPFRFAVQTSSAPDGHAWRERARRIEGHGYSTLYMPDHFGDQWGSLVALTVAAEATTTLRVGGLVFDNDYRHPLVLAKEIATLDLVSEGRVELGLGAGWLRTDYDAAGIAYDEPSVRIDRLSEALDVLDQLWVGSASYEGTHYRLRDAVAAPASRRPPIVVGGGGRRILELAARRADIVGVNPNLGSGAVDASAARSAVASLYDERIDWIRAAAGEQFDALELQALTFLVAVGGNRVELAQQMAPALGITESDALSVPIALVGTVEEICEQLVERRERWGLSYWVVHEPELDDFAPVVARLAGT